MDIVLIRRIFFVKHMGRARWLDKLSSEWAVGWMVQNGYTSVLIDYFPAPKYESAQWAADAN